MTSPHQKEETMTDLPAEALTAAWAAANTHTATAGPFGDRGPMPTLVSEDRVRRILEAAWPYLAAAGPAEAVRLLKEAMHLRVNGERAPGGNETWREWDAKAEAFLRGLRPEHLEDVMATSARADERERCAQLHQLATDILSHYVKTSDGYRARAGQVQIAKWQATLNGEAPHD